MTKVISISDKAYGELSRIKNNDSFSEIIITLTKNVKKEAIFRFAGILNDDECDKIKKDIKETRKLKSGRF